LARFGPKFKKYDVLVKRKFRQLVAGITALGRILTSFEHPVEKEIGVNL